MTRIRIILKRQVVSLGGNPGWAAISKASKTAVINLCYKENMEGQEEVPVNPETRKSIIKKKPQELAAQVESVYATNLKFLTGHPEGDLLDQKYQDYRAFIEELLKSGVSDERLERELGELYRQGRELGIYSPLEAKDKEKFASYIDKELVWGVPESEARRMLVKKGYLGRLREWRRQHEEEIRKHFQDSIESHPISKAEESRRIEQLQERVVYLSNPEQTKALAVQFPGGNFLYHGTKVEQAIRILEFGSLCNVKMFDEIEEERVRREGGEKKIVARNSGYEGISWNYNRVGALPGDRYHLVGFLASPQSVLKKDQQLAVPSRPAPYEVVQINGDIDSNKYYSVKTQQELLLRIGLGETNSVWGNIVRLSIYRERQAKGEDDSFMGEPMLLKFIENNKDVDDAKIANKLREFYSLRENGTVEFSPDLFQQVEDEIPVAAVWLQALIDTGRIKNVAGFENVTTVREVISKIEKCEDFLKKFKKEDVYLEEIVKEEDDKVTPLSVPVSQMYLVVPRTDLRRYLKVIARIKTEFWPKGIIVYDPLSVRLENFASLHRGDNEAMTQALRKAIPISEGHIDYEKQILGVKITPNKMAGYRRHVVAERYLNKRRRLRINKRNELIVA